MIREHIFVVDDSVVELFATCRKQEREDLLRIFRFLAASPSQRGDWIQKAQSGREIQVKRFGRWQVSFWLDAPVLELRVVDVKKVVL
jgi:hypothetical protein